MSDKVKKQVSEQLIEVKNNFESQINKSNTEIECKYSGVVNKIEIINQNINEYETNTQHKINERE